MVAVSLDSNLFQRFEDTFLRCLHRITEMNVYELINMFSSRLTIGRSPIRSIGTKNALPVDVDGLTTTVKLKSEMNWHTT